MNYLLKRNYFERDNSSELASIKLIRTVKKTTDVDTFRHISEPFKNEFEKAK